MLTNKIIHLLTGFIAVLLIPLVPVTTIFLGFLITITFGLLLIPISLIWSCFYFPLLGLSFVWEKNRILRPLISIIAIPISIIGYVFVSLMPSMGEKNSKLEKSLNTTVFPYNWTLFQLKKNSAYPITSGNYRKLLDILYRNKLNNPHMTAFIDKNILNQ